MSKGVLGILLAALLATGVFGVITHRENGRLQTEIGDLRKTLETGAEKLIGAADRDDDELARLRKRVKDLEGELVSARDSGLEAGVETAEENGEVMAVKVGKQQGAMMKNLSKMMEDPGMRAMMEQQQGMMIDGMYGPLFADLGLDEEGAASLRALILERQMAATDIGMRMMDADMTAEERKKLGEELTAERKRQDEEIKALLGEEGHGEFELFEKSQPERQVLKTYKQTLQNKGLELSFEQEEQLMSAMYEERTNFKFSGHDFGDQTKVDANVMNNFTPEKVETYMAEYRQLQGQIVERVTPILDAAQLDEFQASQEAMVKMQEMGMRMGLGMMGREEQEEGK